MIQARIATTTLPASTSSKKPHLNLRAQQGQRGTILVITIAQWSVAMEWGRGVAAGAAAPRGR
jgi:hypothetical protein